MTRRHDDVARGGAAIAARRTESQGLLALSTGVAVVAALYCTQQVLIPLTLAVLLSFVLAPLVDGLERVRLWRAPAVIVTVVAALGIIRHVRSLAFFDILLGDGNREQDVSIAGEAARV